MKRGEIWTLQDKHYASKARPVVVIQSDEHNSFDSVILCLFTSFESEDISTRVRIERETCIGTLGSGSAPRKDYIEGSGKRGLIPRWLYMSI